MPLGIEGLRERWRCAIARAAQSRENFFDFLKPKVYSAATKQTYGSHAEATKDRLKRQKEAKDEKAQARKDLVAARKEKMEDLRYEKERKKLERDIAAADRKIDSAEKKIDAAEKRESKGALTEAGFAAIKARMEREIEAQERHKERITSRNPSFGFGVYKAGGFGEEQLKHFKSKAAAETWARSTGLKGYKIRRAFAKNPAVSAAQYRLARAVLSGNANSKMPRKVAQEIVDRTPARLASALMMGTAGNSRTENKSNRKNCKSSRRNPAQDAAALSEKFHGRPSTSQRTVVEKLHVHKHLMEVGDLVRLVIDTPTGLVAVLNFNTSDPKKIVRLASSEKDPKTGKIVGKQLYFRGGDQEVNLAGLKMDTPLWIRDLMELGRLHEFKRGDPKLIVNGEEVKGSITYRTRKGMDDFKLVDYWHKAGEETARKAGPAARSIVLYDYPNKKLQLAGGQYHIEAPGIIN